MSTPGFDHQSADHGDKNDEPIGAQVGAGDDGERHKQENADQEPVDVQPPGTVPVYIREDLFCQRPPDVNNEEDDQEETTQQYTAGACPAE